MENGRTVVAPRPSRLRFADRREGFLVPAQRANARSFTGDFRRGHPLPTERGESAHQLGEVRQLGDVPELASARREDPAAVREARGDVRSRQLPGGEQEPAIGLQP